MQKYSKLVSLAEGYDLVWVSTSKGEYDLKAVI
jgi:hypothetical protein